jgi:hypothetical protein
MDHRLGKNSVDYQIRADQTSQGKFSLARYASEVSRRRGRGIRLDDPLFIIRFFKK